MKVLVTEFDPIDEEARKILSGVAEVTSTLHCSEEELIRQVGDVNGILVCFAPITRKVIEAAGKLKVIARFGVGYDNVDVKAATERGVVVANYPAIYTEEVAELTLLLMLALARRLPYVDSMVRSGQWFWKMDMATRRRYTNACRTLQGKTLGIIGLGSIGREVARKAQRALNVNVLAYDPWVDDKDMQKLSIDSADLTTLLRNSDIISIHVPLTDSTKGMIGREELRAMKPSAYIINTSRGAIVDELALVEALRNGWIAGAGLEVFAKEPPEPDNPLFKMENVVLSPHIGAQTVEASGKIWIACANAIADVLKGKIPEPPANIVNKDVLKKIRLE